MYITIVYDNIECRTYLEQRNDECKGGGREITDNTDENNKKINRHESDVYIKSWISGSIRNGFKLNS